MKLLAMVNGGDAAESAGHKVGAVMTYAGSGSAFFGGLALSDWGVIVGIITAVTGIAIQFWFKWREDQRQERLFAEKLRIEEEAGKKRAAP